MAVRLFVGNLPYDTTEAALRELFSAVGQLSYVSLPTDRETGKMRGFAFVEFNDRAQADAAVRRFNNEMFKGRPLVVNEARARDASAPPGGRPSTGFSSPSRPAPGGPDFGDSPDRGAAKPPGRNFGPDAPPRGRGGRGKPKSKEGAAPKGPLREKRGGRFFDDGDDVVAEDDAVEDNFATRADDGELEEDKGPVEL
jgi:RNA recognition motif-containing protein